MPKRKRKLINRRRRTRKRSEPKRNVGRITQAVTFSFLPAETDWLETTAEALKRLTGGVQTYRSLLVRESLRRMMEELQGKNPQEILLYLEEQRIRRISTDNNGSQAV